MHVLDQRLCFLRRAIQGIVKLRVYQQLADCALASVDPVYRGVNFRYYRVHLLVELIIRQQLPRRAFTRIQVVPTCYEPRSEIVAPRRTIPRR